MYILFVKVNAFFNFNSWFFLTSLKAAVHQFTGRILEIRDQLRTFSRPYIV